MWTGILAYGGVSRPGVVVLFYFVVLFICGNCIFSLFSIFYKLAKFAVVPEKLLI